MHKVRIIRSIMGGGVLVGAFFLLCAMGVMEHREELGTLKEHGQEADAQEKELAEQEARFQSVKAAIIAAELKAGTSAKEITKKFGKPIDTAPLEKGEKWLYRSRTGKWLDTPWIYIYFDEQGYLTRWECAHTDCF